MERDDARLEGEAGEQEDKPEQQAERRRAAPERRGDAGEAGRSGKAVEQRDSVEQDPARERAEHEIFEAGFGRALVAAAIGGEDVAGEAVELEPDIERNEAGRRDHHAHADGGKDDQHRIFGGMLGPALEPAVGGDDRDRRRREHDRLAEAGEQVLGHEAVEDRPGMRRSADQRGRRCEQQRDCQPVDERRPAAAGEGRDDHQDRSAERTG